MPDIEQRTTLYHDLWTSIITNCDANTALLSPRSKAFRQHAQPTFFNEITITAQYATTIEYTIVRPRIFEKLSFLPHIGLAVQSCTLDLEHIRRGLLPVHPDVLECCFTALSHFVNMRKLELTGIVFTNVLIKRFGGLNTLEWVKVDLGTVVRRSDITRHPLLVVTTRHLSLIAGNAATHELWLKMVDLSQPESLQSSTICARPPPRSFLLPTMQLLPKLRFLSVDFDPMSYWPEFSAFITNCPALENLCLGYKTGWSRSPEGLQPLDLPSLKTYAGQWP